VNRALHPVLALALLSAPLYGQDSLPSSFRELRWQDRHSSQLSAAQRAQIGAAHILNPAEWGLEVAAETLGTTPFLFLRGKIGGGAGYRYYGAFGFVSGRRAPVWSSLAVESWSPFDSTSDPPGFTLQGCLVRGQGALLGFAAAADPPNSAALEALRSDSLVPASGWYRWANGHFALDESVPSQELRAWCREGLAKLP
jgi:hypothetical protein